MPVQGGKSLFWDARIGTDKMKKDAGVVRNIIGTLKRNISKEDVFTALAVSAVAAFTVMSKASTAFAIEYEQNMKEVETISEATQENFEGMSQSILEMSSRLPQAANELSRAFYQIVSAGFDGQQGLTLLDVAARSAVAGVTDAATAADGLTTVLNAFGKSADQVEQVADVMFTTVKLGKTTFGELASSISNVAPLAAASGLAFEDVASSIASLTKQGVPTAQAVTQIRSALIAMNEKLGQGWTATLSFVEGLEQMRVVAAENNETLKEAFGRVEGLSAALALTGVNAQGAKDDLEAHMDAVGAMGEAYTVMADTVTNKSKIARDIIVTMFEPLGSFLKTEFSNALDTFITLFGKAETAFQKFEKSQNKHIAILKKEKTALKEYTDALKKAKKGTIEYRVAEDELSNFLRDEATQSWFDAAEGVDTYAEALRALATRDEDIKVSQEAILDAQIEEAKRNFKQLVAEADGASDAVKEAQRLLNESRKAGATIAAAGGSPIIRQTVSPLGGLAQKDITSELQKIADLEGERERNLRDVNAQKKLTLQLAQDEITLLKQKRAGVGQKAPSTVVSAADGVSAGDDFDFQKPLKLNQTYYIKLFALASNTQEKIAASNEYFNNIRATADQVYFGNRRKEVEALINQEERKAEALIKYEEELRRDAFAGRQNLSDEELEKQNQFLTELTDRYRRYGIDITKEERIIAKNKEIISNNALDKIIKDTEGFNAEQLRDYKNRLKLELDVFKGTAKDKAKILKELGLVQEQISESFVSNLEGMNDALFRFADLLGMFSDRAGSLMADVARMYRDVLSLKEAESTGEGLTSGIGIAGSYISFMKQIFAGGETSTERVVAQLEKMNAATERQIVLLRQLNGEDALQGTRDLMQGIADDINIWEAQILALPIRDLQGEIVAQLGDYQKSIDFLLENAPHTSGQVAGGRYLSDADADALNALLASIQTARDTLAEFGDEYQELLTRATSESITEGIVQGFKDGKSALEIFGENFQGIMRDALFNAFQNKILSQLVNKFYDEFALRAEDGLTEAEIGELRTLFAILSRSAQESYDEMAALAESTGIDLTGGDRERTGLTGAIAGITEDTAGLLAGQFNAMRISMVEVANNTSYLIGMSEDIHAIRFGGSVVAPEVEPPETPQEAKDKFDDIRDRFTGDRGRPDAETPSDIDYSLLNKTAGSISDSVLTQIERMDTMIALQSDIADNTSNLIAIKNDIHVIRLTGASDSSSHGGIIDDFIKSGGGA